MKNVLNKYLYHDGPDAMNFMYCAYCKYLNNNKCVAPEKGCPMVDDDVVIMHFIERVFANYMIPFS